MTNEQIYEITLKELLNRVELFPKTPIQYRGKVRSLAQQALAKHNKARRLMGKDPITFQDVAIQDGIGYVKFKH